MSLNSHLTTLEASGLIHLAEALPELEYLFRHALVQEAAYASLVKYDRIELHRAVGEALERLYPDRLDELAAILAQHFELAGEWPQALAHLQRAANRAHRTAAHREEAALLARALAIAERIGRSDLIASLHTQRGKALGNVTLFTEARQEFELALAAIPPDQIQRRAEALLDLATVNQWLWDADTATRYAHQALALAEQAGRHDLKASATCALAFAEVSDGRTQAGLDLYDQAFRRASEMRIPPHSLLQGMEFSGLTHYWVGHLPAAIERNREAVQRAREAHDPETLMRGMSNLALALGSSGQYAEALHWFEEARQFGRRHEVFAWLARAIAMHGGLRLALFDYARAEALAHEAREVARSANFPPPVVGGGIDLIFIYARSGQPERAAAYVPEVAQALPRVYGSHRWLWENRFVQARAELALARGEWEAAITAADEAVARNRATGRIKYEAMGLVTRAQALLALGRQPEALLNFQEAIALARQLGDPATFLWVAAPRLPLAGDDALLAEAQTTIQNILANLPDDEMRRRFREAEPVRGVLALARTSA